MKIKKKLAVTLTLLMTLSIVPTNNYALENNKGNETKKEPKIAISICTLFVLPAKISELDLKYMSRLGLAYSF